MAYDKSTSERRPKLDTVLNRLYEFAQSQNVADLLDEDQLGIIGRQVCEEFGIDDRSREEWETTAKKAMDVALQVKQPKNYPFPGASNVKWPLITVAALQFNARAYPAICDDPTAIVKVSVKGSDAGLPKMDEAGQPVFIMDPATGQPAVDENGQPQIDWQIPPGAKQERAQRISQHMSYQLSEEQDEWEPDMDTLLMQLPIIGCAFKKVYRDVGENKNCSEMIPAMDLVVNQKVRSLRRAPRVTHKLTFYPHEIDEKQADGLWLDIDIPEAEDGSGDKDAPIAFLEQHRRLDLDGDGYGEPYIVTVHKQSEKVVRIVANYAEDDVRHNNKRIQRIKPAEYFVKFGFIPDPQGGFYDIGFGRLLESIGAAIDTTINQMMDAGHLQNAGGGFIGSGVRLKKAMLRMEPGKYISVDASGDNLRNAIVSMEHPGPSPVLFQLLGLMIEAARDITAVKDIMTGDSGEQTQTATTTLALIEQGMKVFTAIYKRIFTALKKEFKLLFKLNAEYLDEEQYFNVLDTPKAIAKADYNEQDYDVCPQADPKLVTDMQRLKRAEALMATYQINPNPEILRRYYTAIGTEDVDAILPQGGPSPAEQLAFADAEAEVQKKQAETGKIEVEARKVEAETAKTVLEISDFIKSGPPELRKQALAGEQAREQSVIKGSQEREKQIIDGAVKRDLTAMQGEQKKEQAKEAAKNKPKAKASAGR